MRKVTHKDLQKISSSSSSSVSCTSHLSSLLDIMFILPYCCPISSQNTYQSLQPEVHPERSFAFVEQHLCNRVGEPMQLVATEKNSRQRFFLRGTWGDFIWFVQRFSLNSWGEDFSFNKLFNVVWNQQVLCYVWQEKDSNHLDESVWVEIILFLVKKSPRGIRDSPNSVIEIQDVQVEEWFCFTHCCLLVVLWFSNLVGSHCNSIQFSNTTIVNVSTHWHFWANYS